MTDSRTILAPDSPEARHVVQLATHLADLAAARDGFHIAQHFAESDDTTERQLLRTVIADAVVAYARCFQTSYVPRKKLTELVTFPEPFKTQHQVLIDFRNKALGHTENTLQQSYPELFLERDEDGTVEVTGCMVRTVQPAMPAALLRRFADHVKTVHAAVLEQLQTAKAALVESITETAAAELWTTGQTVKVVRANVTDWTVDTRRAEYPTSAVITMYVDIDDDVHGDEMSLMKGKPTGGTSPHST